jgi:hypothetical protein
LLRRSKQNRIEAIIAWASPAFHSSEKIMRPAGGKEKIALFLKID